MIAPWPATKELSCPAPVASLTMCEAAIYFERAGAGDRAKPLKPVPGEPPQKGHRSGAGAAGPKLLKRPLPAAPLKGHGFTGGAKLLKAPWGAEQNWYNEVRAAPFMSTSPLC